MPFEQAFFALPEILHGSGYQRQDYEAGIVSAFTLAVLQVLNGRNVNNPIGCIQAEKLFRTGGLFDETDKPRYLRADLFLDVSRLYVANRRLSQYGWRHNLWLEAKFFRGQAGTGTKHSGNKTNYVASILADLVRLAVLIPETGDESTSGRYFLHAYDAHPQYYLTYRKRLWCRKICEPGTHDIVLEDLNEETDSVTRLLGDMGALKLELNVTNKAAWPLDVSHRPVYWCCFTRINAVKATLGNKTFEININRKIHASDANALTEISGHVASRLHIKPDSSESQPVEDDEDTVDETTPAPIPTAEELL